MLIQKFLPTARRHLQSIDVNAALLQAARRLGEGCDMLLVCDAAGRLAGVLTKTDVVRQTGRCTGASCTAPVIEAMTRDVTTVTPDGWLQDVWDIMKARGFKNIPIVDANRHPLGVLNARDVLQTLLQEVREEENLLHDYVMNIGYR
ncbi:CBS domain-containing protein [Paracoccus methylovorus]|uniref:CBS domain-containing protein n=2 Tax=Paracoccus TaxID=265 RepID=A0ABX7JQG5_9RHOB|nr:MULTISPECIES: CBS domain-containing protein [Paracoccus]ABL71102.1 putative signal-transduction protein with CBS domains [Paracoccus denitrificans PD1222]MBB4628300.1 arabinose-5-phosphate isomerase [Paracoccus denitrificans]MCU7429355.1 CBS domain-containing protein [Paracoccus denitrificans]MDK8873343.1 CBS domain-containing protein [Paracoccus sp. SSJ]QRZ15234.1 CBS domain-containing protein [Paracoccus methylovorus]